MSEFWVASAAQKITAYSPAFKRFTIQVNGRAGLPAGFL